MIARTLTALTLAASLLAVPACEGTETPPTSTAAPATESLALEGLELVTVASTPLAARDARAAADGMSRASLEQAKAAIAQRRQPAAKQGIRETLTSEPMTRLGELLGVDIERRAAAAEVFSGVTREDEEVAVIVAREDDPQAAEQVVFISVADRTARVIEGSAVVVDRETGSVELINANSLVGTYVSWAKVERKFGADLTKYLKGDDD